MEYINGGFCPCISPGRCWKEIYEKLPRGIDFGPHISRLSHVLWLKTSMVYSKRDVCGINTYTRVAKFKFKTICVWSLHLLQTQCGNGNIHWWLLDNRSKWCRSAQGVQWPTRGIWGDQWGANKWMYTAENGATWRHDTEVISTTDLDEMWFNYRTKGGATPALSSQILGRDYEGNQKITSWNYRSILGKLNDLVKSTRPDIAYAPNLLLIPRKGMCKQCCELEDTYMILKIRV